MKKRKITVSPSKWASVLTFLAAGAANSAGEIPITSFEKTDAGLDPKAENATIKLVSGKGVSDGKKALQVDFEVDTDFAGFEITPAQPWDTTSLGDFHLRYDAYNPSDRSVFLAITVTNAEGHNIRRAVGIPARSSGSYYFELKSEHLGEDYGLRDDPDPFALDATRMIVRGHKYAVDFSKVKSLKIGTQSIIHDKSVVIDNLRFVSSPKTDPDFLVDIVDEFGQNAKRDIKYNVTNEGHLKELADAEMRALAVSKPMQDRSSWGGWKDGPKFEATGHFRTHKYKGQWALIDPDGYIFFSSGIANIRMANTSTFTGVDFRDDSVRYRDPEDVTPEDSVGIVSVSDKVRQTRYIIDKTRHKMFVELPEYDSELANHYSYRRSTHKGPVPHGETFSFYQANLERRYGETFPGSYLQKWRDITLDRMIDWGFTSFGNWVAPEFYHAKRFPYFANGWIIGDFKRLYSGADYWGPIPDPYDPEFERRAKYTTMVIADEVLNSPWCIGVFVDNEMSWGLEDTYGIVLDALRQPLADSPAKQAFVKILKKKYPQIGALNQMWATDFASWKAFEQNADLRDTEHSEEMIADFSILKEDLASTYFRIVHDALEDVLPNHLYMGARFASWGMSKEVRAGAKKYVDVMSFNHYREGLGKKKWEHLKDMDLPCIIGEYHFGARDSGVFDSGIIEAADQKDRAEMYTEYMESVLENPYFVGAHWFQYIDSPLTGRAHDGENYNVGFVTIADVPYPEMVDAAKKLNRNLYQNKYGD
ncbi:beta-galactosidase [Pelagicoccus sp. SDUM812003]|uniref:beta-galactosidase n=1 Tax=Pelagicoccus sp. SDUM812003 TaxID=3041267 RepID=UPI00280E8684|nr:beta-galactosidase [Pelagicoccus sp. SDUM812003]MDQ8201435.1 beta-galactosidase [Pelagicoccus sp. SDUM812003]